MNDAWSAGLVALALAAPSCVRSGAGTRSGSPIDARGQPLELIACQTVPGEEHARTEITATTWLGLNPRTLASRAGQESGVRGHPRDPDVVVFARQTRADGPSATELFVSSLRAAFADVRLTRNGSADLEPCWSEDGSRVLFASDRGGTLQIWQVDRAGGDPVLLTQPPAGAADRAPDARAGRVVFSRTIATGDTRRATLWIMHPDGSGLAALTTGAAGSGAGGFVPGDREPALAPDGSSVVFARRTAPDRAVLMRLELASARLSELAPTADGEDRMPRFLPGGQGLLAGRTAPGAGLLGRRLVAVALDGSDPVQLTMDPRLAMLGADVLAGAGTLPTPAAQPSHADLDTDDARIVIGQRTLGRFTLVRDKDGSGLQLATVPFAGKERAGVFLPFKLALLDPGDVARVHVRATFALTVADAESRVRISVKDYVHDRYDVAWDGRVPDTRFTDAAFAFASLAHVDRDGWIRIELAAELAGGRRAELAIDAVEVDVFARAPRP